MRTTLNLSPRVHQRLIELAKDKNKTVSAVAEGLLFECLFLKELPEGVTISPITGLAVTTTGKPTTFEEVEGILADMEEAETRSLGGQG